MSRANRKNRYSTTPESLYNKLVGQDLFVCYIVYFAKLNTKKTAFFWKFLFIS